MPLRTLLKYLANNERLVQKLSDSYPMRRAAQFTISLFYRSKEKFSQMDPSLISKFKSFYRHFGNNIREGIEDVKRQLKK